MALDAVADAGGQIPVGTALGALVGQLAMQVGVAAVTAMMGQLTHALCATRKAREETAPEAMRNHNTSGLLPYPPFTPIRPSKPPGMEEHRMDGSQEEAPSNISTDPLYDEDDTPIEVRRERTEAHITDFTGDLLQKTCGWKALSHD